MSKREEQIGYYLSIRVPEIVEISQIKNARTLAGLEGPHYWQMLQGQLEVLELIEKLTRSTTSTTSTTSSRRIASAFHESYGRKINLMMLQRELRVLEKEGVIVVIQEGIDFSIRLTLIGGEVLRLWRSRRNGDQ